MLNDILDDQLDFNPIDFNEKTITEINLLKIDANQHVKHIKEGRVALIVLCALTILAVVVSAAAGNEYATSSEIILEGVILFVIYGACAMLLKRNPRASLLVALVVYVLVILLSAIIDPATIISGIIVKGLIIFYLGRSIFSAFELQKVMQKLRKLGISDKELSYLQDLDIVTKTKRKSRADDIL